MRIIRVSAVAAAAAAVLALAACGGGTATGGSGGGNTKSTTLTYWASNQGATLQTDYSVLNPQLAKFKQQTGIALVDFRNRQRVERFLGIYGTGQRLTMLQAAFEAGFGSYAQFHRVFKRVTGISPGEHRRKLH